MRRTIAVIGRDVANSDLGTDARLTAFEAGLGGDLKGLGGGVLAEHCAHHGQAGGINSSDSTGKELILWLGVTGLRVLRINRTGGTAGEDGQEQTREQKTHPNSLRRRDEALLKKELKLFHNGLQGCFLV